MKKDDLLNNQDDMIPIEIDITKSDHDLSFKSNEIRAQRTLVKKPNHLPFLKNIESKREIKKRVFNHNSLEEPKVIRNNKSL